MNLDKYIFLLFCSLIMILFIQGCQSQASVEDAIIHFQFKNEWCGDTNAWRTEACSDYCNTIALPNSEAQCQSYCVKAVADIAMVNQASNGTLNMEDSDIWINK